MPATGPDETAYAPGYLDDAPELCRLLGLFVARWSLAEATLLYPLKCAVSGSDHVLVSLLSSAVSTEGKIKLVKSSVQSSGIPSDKKIAILKSLKDFEKACEQRNSFMHHLWCRSENDEVVTFDYRKPPGQNLRKTRRSEEDIKSACNNATVIAFEICKAAGSDWFTEEALIDFTLTSPVPAA